MLTQTVVNAKNEEKREDGARRQAEPCQSVSIRLDASIAGGLTYGSDVVQGFAALLAGSY